VRPLVRVSSIRAGYLCGGVGRWRAKPVSGPACECGRRTLARWPPPARAASVLNANRDGRGPASGSHITHPARFVSIEAGRAERLLALSRRAGAVRLCVTFDELAARLASVGVYSALRSRRAGARPAHCLRMARLPACRARQALQTPTAANRPAGQLEEVRRFVSRICYLIKHFLISPIVVPTRQARTAGRRCV
jgi:hypothetical protein